MCNDKLTVVEHIDDLEYIINQTKKNQMDTLIDYRYKNVVD